MSRRQTERKPIGGRLVILLAASLLGGCIMPADQADLDNTQNISSSDSSRTASSLVSSSLRAETEGSSREEIMADPSSSNASKPAGTIILQDDMNRQVEIENPERIAVLIGSFADLLADAGGKDRIVAAAHDTWTSFDLDLDSSVRDLGDVKSIAQETLLAAKPDLVIASAKNDSQKQMMETLNRAGIPVVYYDVDDFDDYMRVLHQMTQITGDESAWQSNGLDQEKEMEAIRNTAHEKRPRVLALRQTGKGLKALGSDSSVLGRMLADLKTDNIAGAGGLDTLSMEVVAKENPQMIFYVAQGKDLQTAQAMANTLFSSDAWKDLDAVKNGNVYVLDARLYNLKPNARWAKALKDLEEIVYGR